MPKLREIEIHYEDASTLYIRLAMIEQMVQAAEALAILNQATQIAKRLARLQEEEE